VDACLSTISHADRVGVLAVSLYSTCLGRSLVLHCTSFQCPLNLVLFNFLQLFWNYAWDKKEGYEGQTDRTDRTDKTDRQTDRQTVRLLYASLWGKLTGKIKQISQLFSTAVFISCAAFIEQYTFPHDLHK